MVRRRRLKKPVKLTDVVDAQSRRWRFQKLQRLEIIRSKWVEAAGEYVARHAAPIRLVRKTLRVAVEDSSWANELSYLNETILERLQALLPGKWVEEIRVVQNEPLPPPPEPEPPVELSVATGEMRARVDRALAGIEDGELCRAIRRAMLKSLRRLDAERQSGVDQGESNDRNGE